MVESFGRTKSSLTKIVNFYRMMFLDNVSQVARIIVLTRQALKYGISEYNRLVLVSAQGRLDVYHIV